MATPAKAFTTIFRKKTQEAKDTWTFFFDRPKDYNFSPGQYNRITLPIAATDDRGNNRQFTISSSPTEKDYIAITTKIIQSDFKKAFATLSPDTSVQFFGPLGGFYLREEFKGPRVFLAGGIGITPFRSMLKFAVDTNITTPITLIVSFSTVEEVVFFDELSKIANSNDIFKVIYSISHPEQSKKSWTGEVGRISENLFKKYIQDFQKPEFMIVGPTQMVDNTVEILQTLNVPETHIKVEHFTGY